MGHVYDNTMDDLVEQGLGLGYRMTDEERFLGGGGACNVSVMGIV